MRYVDCPAHDELVLQLAQGLLEGTDAAHAEQIREECEHCSTWWQEELVSQSTRQVDLAVQEALRDFRSPRTRRSHQWDYVAAAAVVALVVGTMIFSPTAREMRVGREPVTTPVALEVVKSDLIRSEGFEDGLNLTPINTGAAQADLESHPTSNRSSAEKASDTIFTDDLEDGNSSGWSQHS